VHKFPVLLIPVCTPCSLHSLQRPSKNPLKPIRVVAILAIDNFITTTLVHYDKVYF
jgi:hypothetical protein